MRSYAYLFRRSRAHHCRWRLRALRGCAGFLAWKLGEKYCDLIKMADKPIKSLCKCGATELEIEFKFPAPLTTVN